jgi:hypothetical protein
MTDASTAPPPGSTCPDAGCVTTCAAAAASHGSLGCDFVVSTPAFNGTTPSPCFVVFLTNGGATPATIQVAYGATPYDPRVFARIPSAGTPPSSWPVLPDAGLPPSSVAVLFLSSDPTSSNVGTPLGCPVLDALDAGTEIWGTVLTEPDGAAILGAATGRGSSWHLSTSVPVSGYDILPFGGARSFLPGAQLLLPTTAWGTNYVAALPPVSMSRAAWGQVLAAQDDTHVTVLPSIDLPGGGGVDAAAQGTPSTFTLSANEYLQWQWGLGSADMSGTILSSDKPILFVGGNGYFCMHSATSTSGGCDSEHETVPPVSSMGYEYAVAPYTTRRADLMPESVPYRILAAVDGTVLTFDPPVAGVPAALAQGQVFDFESEQGFIVTSQDAAHPFWIAQSMTGCMVTSGSRPGVDPTVLVETEDCLGDEDFVGVMTPSQWLSQYEFFTDPTYATTNLVVTRAKTASGFADVTVDCAGVLSGWQPIGGSGQYEMTNVDLVRGGQSVAGCQNGPHVATSDGPFGLVVWGLDGAASYSYPAGGSFRSINSVVIPPVPR